MRLKEEFWVQTRVLGSVVELSATHLETGVRFVARAAEWHVVEHELHCLINLYGSEKMLHKSRGKHFSRQVSTLLRNAAHKVRQAIPRVRAIQRFG